MCGAFEGYDTPADRRRNLEKQIKHLQNSKASLIQAYDARIASVQKELDSIK